MKHKIEWLNRARGLGMVAVVAGHTLSYPGVHRVMYLFHMPLFFALAGMVFSPATMGELFNKRIRSLLIPYVAFLVVITLFDLAISGFAHRATTLPLGYLRAALWQVVLGGQALKGIYGVFWFVTCLFGVQVLANFLANIWGPPGGARWAVAVGGAFVLAYILPTMSSPLDIAIVPMAFVFFIAGWLYRAHDLQSRLGPLANVAIGLAALAAALITAPLDMKYGNYGTPFLTPVVALTISHLVCVAARSARTRLDPVLERLGQASMVLMYMHLPVFYALKDLLAAPFVFVLSLALPLIGYWLAQKWSISRMLWLGQRLPA